MRKKWSLIFGFILLASLFYMSQEFIVYNIYSKIPIINLCFLSFGYEDGGDFYYPLKEECYSLHADHFNDYESCLELTFDRGACLARVSSKTGVYLCSKAPDWRTMSSCDYDVVGNHALKGIEKYRVNHTEKLTPGWNICERVKTEELPIMYSKATGKQGLMYITGCSYNGNSTYINYFTYNLSY